MPKIYTSEEKERIRDSLRREASRCLALYGVRRTTVDELVNRVEIPKGTFYLFYKNKEELFFDVLVNFSKRIENMYLQMLQELDENHIVTSLTDVFTEIAIRIYKEGIFRFLSEGEMELITRRVDKSTVENATLLREGMLRNLFSYFAIEDENDIEAFSKGFEAILYTLLHAERIPEIEKTLRFLIRGLVLQMVE